MPELPEVQAHAERLDREFRGRPYVGFDLLSFSSLKTVAPSPDDALGHRVGRVGRRGKHLLVEVGPVTFVVHLMQGGRLVPDTKLAAKPRNGRLRLRFGPAESADRADVSDVELLHDPSEPLAVLLTEAGTERRAGLWCVLTSELTITAPLDHLGPEVDALDAEGLRGRLAATNQRLHGALRDQRVVAGIGRRLANEVCHRASLSPFTLTGKLGLDTVERIRTAIAEAIADDLTFERARDDMSSSAERPGHVHGRSGEPCPVCGDTIRSIEYRDHRIDYCAACQTGGKVLADNTTSRFLK